MSPRRTKYILGILMIVTALNAIVSAEDPPMVPDLVKKSDNDNPGVLGQIERSLWPLTSVILQYVNSALIHTKKQQLPCTIYDLAKLKYVCTEVKNKPKDDDDDDEDDDGDGGSDDGGEDGGSDDSDSK